MVSATRWGLAALIATACSRSSEEKQGDAPPAPVAATTAGLGSLRFAVTGGTPAARAHFERGLLALHSFWYDEAERAFQAAIDADRTFSMAYWGLAMSKARLLWGDDRVGEARVLLARLPRPDLLSEREKAWLQAARVLFSDADVATSRRAFAAEMEKLYAAHPDDESATFLAAALIARLRPGDPDEAAVRERAIALAGEVFARNPRHPGAAHYLIHACDTPELAERAMPAARAYAEIAPAAFHALHMPAHIFARLGMWKEAIASCQAAWDASVAEAARHRLGPDHHDFHSLSWLVEVSFERGRRRDADAAMERFADAVRGGLSPENRIAYLNQVISYLGRTGEWGRVDELLAALEGPVTGGGGTAGAATLPGAADAPPGTASCAQHAPASTTAMLQLFERRAFATARARAAAARRRVPDTRRHIDEIRRVDGELHELLIRTQSPDLVERQELANQRSMRGLLARAQGDRRGLLAVLQEMDAAGPEPSVEGLANAFVHREGVADELLALGRAREALAAYQDVVRAHPGRSRAMLGAARAAKRAGDPDLARTWYARLLEVWAEADEGTPGLAEARAAAGEISR
jgi:tetratricopeptide (TPR) repeat protein